MYIVIKFGWNGIDCRRNLFFDGLGRERQIKREKVWGNLHCLHILALYSCKLLYLLKKNREHDQSTHDNFTLQFHVST